jgi:competence protein ComGC
MLKKEKGFTLVEMLIVLMIMTTLLLIAVPNLKKHNTIVNNKSCSAIKSLVEGQMETYAIENEGSLPLDMSDLSGYVNKVVINEAGNGKISCPGNKKVVITDGVVSIEDDN